MKFSKLGATFSLLFFGLVVLASLLAVFGGGEFAGIFLLFLGLPWTLLLEPLVDSLGYVQWYGQFSGSIDTEFLYSLFATFGILPGALINAGILYALGALFGSVGNTLKQEARFAQPQTTTHTRKTFTILFWILLFLVLLVIIL